MKSPLKIKLFLLCAFLLATQFVVLAQPTNPSAPPDVPITGIEILIGAGALIGARKIARLRNKK
ncbi:MAG TPA: hypothetical protein PLJ60_20330 [Chryseolinea sp.]|nr:hypothetical protein [Chryseolinea sp.]